VSRPSDLLVVIVIVVAVVWLDVPKLLLPTLFLTLIAVSAYRWRREGREPMAAERYRSRLVASCVAIAAISIPLVLKMVPPNGVYGFRNSVTRSSIDIWYSANAFMGWALLSAVVASGVTLLVLPPKTKRWQLLATFLVPVLLAVAASFIYLDRLA
jgi:SdpI/YhfL family protein